MGQAFKIRDLTGQRFGSLTVIEPVGRDSKHGGGIIWRCQCDCGNTVDMTRNKIVNLKHPSCGCVNIALKDSIGMRMCIFRNDGVACYKSDNCRKCGWNPKVEAKRKARYSKKEDDEPKPNEDIRELMRDNGITIKRIAAAWPCCAETMSKYLSGDLDKQKREKILRIIADLTHKQ